MKGALIMPVLAAVLLAGACNEATTPDTRAQVRFVNATTGMSSGGFTTNGQFAAGSALASGQWAQKCTRVNAGSTTFGFGAVDPKGGKGLSINPLATLCDQSVTDGRDIIVVATGSATSPQLFLFDNNFSGQLGPSEAAIRFVNLAPGPDAANTYVVFKGAVGLTAPIAVEIVVGAPTPFSNVAAGSNEFSIVKMPGHIVAVEGSGGTLDLQAGTFNTVAILPNSPDGFRLVNLPRCS